MKLKLISDGTRQNTKVIDVDTGRQLEGVVAVECVMSKNTLPRLRIELINVAADIEGDVDENRIHHS